MNMINKMPPLAGKVEAVGKKNLSTLYTGYFLLVASFALYLICEYMDMHENFFTPFCVHYLIAIGYFVYLVVEGSFGIRKSWRKENLSQTALLANLVLISAYALNREFVVFADSTNWFCVYILLSSAILLTFHYYNRLPLWFHNVQFLFLGSASVLYLYLAVYVANFYVLGSVGMIAFGIGGHVFVPAFLLTLSIVLFLQFRSGRHHYYWVGAGVILPVAAVIIFAGVWKSRIEKIERFTNQSVMYQASDLPSWVTIAQTIKPDWISERILKEDIVYITMNDQFQWDFMPKSAAWDEIKKHDPLVFLSSMIVKPSLPNEDRLKILKAISNGRHRANERLWAGDNLTTSYIISDVDIYPGLRLAYTEKYFNIRNNSANGRWWGNTEEGIYTFYLPEGSVVTSLSLWINGKEEKGILTSKQKATEAYKTIVGVEARDPSVVHWQEGNTVTVRVFPCTPNEERKFKIGITSPLRTDGEKVYYTNAKFDGPDAGNAKETTRVRFIGNASDISINSSFEKNSKGEYLSEHTYDPDFEISFNRQPVSGNQFTFDGYTYSMFDYQPSYAPVDFKNIFLDINTSWNKNELNALQSLVDNYDVFVFVDNEKIKLSTSNWADITSELREQNFSLFPFYKVSDAGQTLVITKGKILSPHLTDLKGSYFAGSTSGMFANGPANLNVFNLEGSSSTYINSLREFRAFAFASGTTTELNQLLADKKFPVGAESDQQIVLHDASVTVTRKKADDIVAQSNAPDHLARLFLYNDIMRKVGPHYFSEDYINDALVDEAATAYVVSPVSSIVVLETQKDYDKFDIHDKDNSLGNASKQSSGAVPEPHEWALIVIFLLTIAYLKFKQ